MSIEGRITVDALFHDKDGTASLKVVSLEESTAYSTGKVISVTATVAAGTSTIPVNQYRDASGSLVSISPQLLVFKSSGSGAVSQNADNGTFAMRFVISPDRVAVVPVQSDYSINIVSFGTATYTAVIYGT